MDWNQFLSNLQTNPMVNMGLGMMQAAGPSMQPVGFGQTLTSGMQMVGQAQHQKQLADMYQAETLRMQQKAQQEQAAAAQAQAERASLFGGAPAQQGAVGAPQGVAQQTGQAIPDPMHSTSLQQWLGTPGAKVMYDKAPQAFWQQYNDLSNPKPIKPEYRQVGNNLLSIGPDGKPHVVYTAPQDESGAGPDALLTDDAKSLMATALSHGYNIPLPSFGIGAAGAKAKAQALNQLAANIKANGVSWDDGVSNMIQGKTATAGLQDVQKTSAKVNAWENSASKQADITLGLSNAVDRSGVPLFNKWTLAGRQATGDVEVAKFNNAVSTLAEEYARVMGGGNAQATDSTRELAHTMLNSAMTQEQFNGVVSLMKQEMAVRKSSLSESVDQTRGSIVGKKPEEHAGAPKVGDTEQGYRYKGGDPANPSSWEKV